MSLPTKRIRRADAKSMTELEQNNVRGLINEITEFIGLHYEIINCHMVDYFIDSAYEKAVSQELREEITGLGYSETIKVLMNVSKEKSTPLLSNFVKSCERLYLHNLNDVCINRDVLKGKLSAHGYKEVEGTNLKIFVSPKKSHEVRILSGLCASLNSLARSSHLIDIGDGKGYLSSVLALQYKFSVLGIEASQKKTKGAIDRLEKLTKNWKEARGTNNGLYKQVTQYVNLDTDLTELVNETFECHPSSLGLVGLHTCGDLGPNSLRLFTSNKCIKTICNVSCCYHLLTEQDCSNQSWGFPLSRHLEQKQFRLGRFARMLSCQSIDRILYKKETPSKILLYRAILQVFLYRNQLDLSRHVGKVSKEPETFENYASEALKHLGYNKSADCEELKELYGVYEKSRGEFNVFYLMRCLLAPVVESLLLLDRLLFLYESGHEHAYLVRLFDPVVSPRCYGIIALKLNQ